MKNILSKHIKKFAIIASMLMLTMIAVPMVAAETNYKYCDETDECDEMNLSTSYDIIKQPIPEFTIYDLCGAEIEIIDGMPFMIVEVEDKYINISFPLSDKMDMMADGASITIEVDGNYLLTPTKEGIEKVCISEFDMKIVDGQLIMVHEVNPELIIQKCPVTVRWIIERILAIIAGGLLWDRIGSIVPDAIDTEVLVCSSNPFGQRITHRELILNENGFDTLFDFGCYRSGYRLEAFYAGIVSFSHNFHLCDQGKGRDGVFWETLIFEIVCPQSKRIHGRASMNPRSWNPAAIEIKLLGVNSGRLLDSLCDMLDKNNGKAYIRVRACCHNIRENDNSQGYTYIGGMVIAIEHT